MLEELNPEQRLAVEHLEGPCLVLAGAGSGKTRVLTTRVCHLILEHGVAADRILAVTFTNKAAREMRDRVAAMLGGLPRGIRISTFHAMGASLLRRHAPMRGRSRAFAIRDADQSLREVRKAQKSVGVDPLQCSPRAVRDSISDAKNRLVGAEDFIRAHRDGRNLFLKRVSLVYPAYQEALRGQDAVDFDDLLVEPVRLFEDDAELLRRYRERFTFVLVDEYQDTNRAQFRLLELLARSSGNLMAVGDDDQSIYGWRGADIRNILDFERSFPGAKVVRLERNYRSTPVILEAANAVIRQNAGRKEKTMWTDRAGGPPVTLLEAENEADEGRWIVAEIERRMLAHPEYDHRDFAVLYRTNAQSRALEDRFRRRGLPYQIVGGVRFYERREIQDVLAYLRLVANARDMDAFDRAVNYPRRGVGRVTLERLARFARAEGIGLLRAAGRADRVPGLTAPARRGLADFAGLIARYANRTAHRTAGELLEELVAELDLAARLRSEGPEGKDRAENVLELIAAARDFEAERVIEDDEDDRDAFTDLDLFLQHVALVTDLDFHDAGADAVTLMTLHGAKGLEFPVVLISGMEEGLFPLSRAYDEPRTLEEERRLFYVGVTRAMDRLYLTHARRRRRAGETAYGRLSSFVSVLEDLERETTDLAAGSRTGYLRTVDESGREGTSGPRTAGSVSVDDDAGFNQDRPRYLKGERVVHRTFGSGTIVELSGFGRDLRVTVNFDEAGRKKLLVRYAALERDYF
ncbi:MAG: UvrD-helicase domain-containing protein [Gemmatimonadota bacterium]|nr:UvrD-helicase domain-containing protein [Gemmatimonadota bacterium]